MTQPSSDNQLERDLQHAQQFGRWLSDEEAACLDQEEKASSDVVERRDVGRRKLIILIALSVFNSSPLATGPGPDPGPAVPRDDEANRLDRWGDAADPVDSSDRGVVILAIWLVGLLP